MELEFLKFDKTPNERHLGIATIRVERRFIFRFKVMQNPKGEGYFLNAPAVKIEERYWPAFAFDSFYEADTVKEFVLSNAKIHLAPASSKQYGDTPAVQEEFNFNTEPF